MKLKRLLSFSASLAMSINCLSAFDTGSLAEATEPGQTEEYLTEEDFDLSQDGTHAYDPMEQIRAEEAEAEFRENAQIAENKILFSVLDYRKNDADAVCLSDKSDICKEYKLKKVFCIYDTVYENADKKAGYTAYQVFYEAVINSDDVWTLVDKLNEDENILNAEPDFIWNDTAEGDPVEVTEEEYSNSTQLELLDAKNVWAGLNPETKAGKGVVVAVIDTGVDYNHKDLKDNIWVNTDEIPDNGIDDDNNNGDYCKNWYDL